MTVTTVPTYTAAQVRAAEGPLVAAGEPLMARASAALAAIVREQASGLRRPRVLVVAGSGDNGGDALFAAAHLAPDIEVDALLVSDRFHAAALAAAVAAGVRRVEIVAVRAVDSPYDVVVDGILGIGTAADPALRGTARLVVEALLPAVREGRSRVVAADLPSGLQPDTGDADDAVLPATVTVTFGAVKAGLAVGRGPRLTGELVLVDLGLGPRLSGETPAGAATVARVLDHRG